MLRDRLILGTILIAAALLGAWADHWLDGLATPALLAGIPGVGATLPPGLLAVPIALLLAAVAAQELWLLLRLEGVRAERWLVTLASVLGVLVTGLGMGDGLAGIAAVASAAGALIVLAQCVHSAKRRTDGTLAAAGGVLLAFVYLGLLPGFLVALRREHHALLVVALVLVIKASDIGAYFTGRLIGRHKLIPWLSPGKTWEGLFGGIAVAAAAGALAATLLAEHLPPTPGPAALGAFAGAWFALLGQLGDLVASLMKRDAGVKDAGRSMPGFGGMLDVIDSLLLALPAAYWGLRWLDAAA